jgi:hypothetical protein
MELVNDSFRSDLLDTEEIKQAFGFPDSSFRIRVLNLVQLSWGESAKHTRKEVFSY